ncbi:MAG TPA: DUF1844 domain-containing protein [Planctomycetota bacterium]|nr:DUF1844 domain-containing protein [Planctomycetota bacterium]
MTSESEDVDPGPRIREKKADEGWKERAQKEKEKLAGGSKGREGAAEREPGADEAPQASFLALLEELAIRAMMALGQIRDPMGDVRFDIEAAKYTIDLLGVLEVKTKGNVDAHEAAALRDLLHNLRLAYVQLSRNPPPAAGPAREPQAPPPTQKPGPKIVL